MTEQEQQRLVNHRLAVLRHAEEVTGNVAQTCRYFGKRVGDEPSGQGEQSTRQPSGN